MWLIWLIALIVIIGFYLWVALIFFRLAIEVILNVALLWIAGTRSYVEIKNEKKVKVYLIGTAIAALLFIAGYNGFKDFSSKMHVWLPVLFLMVAFLISQAIIYADKLKQRFK